MYRYLDAAVIRVAAWPAGQAAGPWPELTGPAAGPASWRRWLDEITRVPGFLEALEQASPALAGRVREIVDGREPPEPVVRRAVLATMRYLLRAQGRATPFGLFAGVAPAVIGDRPRARVGAAHRATARVPTGWLLGVLERLEADPALQPRLTLRANNLVREAGGCLVLEHRASDVPREPPTHVRARAAGPVRAAMALARDPIRWDDLAGKLAADFPHAARAAVDRLLGDLVAQRFLITGLRPSMTATDPLGHVVGALEPLPAGREAAELRRVADELRQHDDASSWAAARIHRASAVAAMTDLSRTEAGLSVDLRLDCDVEVPRAVADEVARAAGVLARLAPRPDLGEGWAEWHRRFLERFGPRALVPVAEAVDAHRGVGFPAGYLDAPLLPGAALTRRDGKLLALAQRAALAGEREIVLDDALVDDLSAASPESPVQGSTELTVRVHAASIDGLRQGAFTLSVVGVSRSAGITTGRFLDLFDDCHRRRLVEQYATAPTLVRGALVAQVSAPTRYADSDDVARVPRTLPYLLPVGEYHDGGGEAVVELNDVAVTADVDRIFLVSLSRRRPVEPVMLHAVEPVARTHPLVRFLCEATTALGVRPCAAFDWGAAAQLPFLPAVRCGRTVLSPARWVLPAADLPGPASCWERWDDALTAWREQVGLPARVYVGGGDRRIGLDLAEPAHRALLRAEVDRGGRALLRAAPDDEAAGWIGGSAHELVIALAATGPPVDAPWWRDGAEVTGHDDGHPPGCDGRFSLKLYASRPSQTEILIHHLPPLLDELAAQVSAQARCWFVRYHDPDEHLRLRLTVPAARFAATAERLGAWTRRLRADGLAARAQWDTYFPETARFGGVAAIDAAESFFEADSAAVLAQLTCCTARNGPDPRAMTAASLLDLAVSLIGEPAPAMRWLIDHSRPDVSAPARALYDQALALANPHDQSHLVAQPGGEQVAARWARRRTALAAYHDALRDTAMIPATRVLPDLLHLHHVRMAGTDLPGERACLHLARAAALSWTARAEKAPGR